MLTNEQLIEARKRAEKWLTMGGAGKDTGTYVLLLLDHIEQLTTHNRVMQVALAQFSDGENWSTAPSVRYVQTGEWPSSVDHPVYIWHVATNPQQLAERALVGDGEVSTTNEN